MDPVKDFYRMRWNKKKEIAFFALVPILLGMLFLLCDAFMKPVREFNLDNFVLDMLNQLVTVLTL